MSSGVSKSDSRFPFSYMLMALMDMPSARDDRW